MNVKVIYAPKYEVARGDGVKCKFFLAGSIEQGKAEEWQQEVIDLLKEKNVIIYNPRRLDWNDKLEQDKDDANFYEQVNWELDHIEKADIVLMYFDPASKSPISLLELGILTAYPNKLLVCCPQGFWRKGNIDIVCQRYNIKTTESKAEFLKKIQEIDFAKKRLNI